MQICSISNFYEDVMEERLDIEDGELDTLNVKQFLSLPIDASAKVYFLPIDSIVYPEEYDAASYGEWLKRVRIPVNDFMGIAYVEYEGALLVRNRANPAATFGDLCEKLKKNLGKEIYYLDYYENSFPSQKDLYRSLGVTTVEEFEAYRKEKVLSLKDMYDLILQEDTLLCFGTNVYSQAEWEPLNKTCYTDYEGNLYIACLQID